MSPRNDPGKESEPSLRESLPPPHFLVSDSEEDDSQDDEDTGAGEQPDGYQLLAQDEGDNEDSSDEGDDDEEHVSRPANFQVEALAEEARIFREREEAEERIRLWQGAANPGFDLNMDNIENIKCAMAKFSLPDSAVPQWAKEVKEEEWADAIKDKLLNQRKND